MSTTPTRAAIKGPSYMPAPGSTRAPTKFKGKNAELREFLEEFDGHAKAQELTDEERVHAVLNYGEKDWNKMKTELFNAYPGSKKRHHYTVKGLMKLAEKNAKNRINEEGDLIEYYRQFRVMSRPLRDDKKVSVDESNRYFWYGLHKHNCKEILGRIELKDSKFDRTTVPDMELAFKMGREVFSDDVLGMESDDPIAEMFTKPKKKKKGKVVVIESTSESEDVEDSDSSESEELEEEKPKRKKMVKQVVRTKIVEKPQMDSVEDLAKQLRALNVQDVNYAGVYARLATISPVVAGAIAALPPIPQIVTTAAIPAVQMAPYPNRPLTPAMYPNLIEIQRNNYRRAKYLKSDIGSAGLITIPKLVGGFCLAPRQTAKPLQEQ
ncbi:hypothetical protein EV359DRAFT_68148 [Lentinula novae-zelandiae]|nr:hypothetical protein EV359DRAFT_68148 [Lentinula novae-zelandiae]